MVSFGEGGREGGREGGGRGERRMFGVVILNFSLLSAQQQMFIAAPDETFKYKLDKLGGVRVITH